MLICMITMNFMELKPEKNTIKCLYAKWIYFLRDFLILDYSSVLYLLHVWRVSSLLVLKLVVTYYTLSPRMISTNYIGAFVLTKLLLPLLESSPVSSRIVNVTSFTHRAGRDNQFNPYFLVYVIVRWFYSMIVTVFH